MITERAGHGGRAEVRAELENSLLPSDGDRS